MEKNTASMLRVDGRRMFLTPLFYIILGIIVAMPVLILVMTGMMEGTPVTDPQTQLPVLDENGNQVLREGFDSVWQIKRLPYPPGGLFSLSYRILGQMATVDLRKPQNLALKKSPGCDIMTISILRERIYSYVL